MVGFEDTKPAGRSPTRDKRRQSLRQNIMALLGLLGLMAMLVIGTSTTFFVYRTEQAAWKGRQAEAARSAADKVATFISNSKTTLYDISVLDPAYLQANPKVMRQILDANPAFLELTRLDAAGKVLAESSQEMPLLANLFTIPQSNWFLSAAAGREYVGGVQISSENEPYLIIAIPASDGGVVAVRLSMNVLWEVASHIRFGQTGQAYVIDRTGQILAHTKTQVVFSGTTLAGRLELEAVLNAPDAEWNGEFTNFEGQQVVGSAYPVAGTDWIVITELPQSEAYAASRTALVVLGGGMTALGLVIMWIIRQLLKKQLFIPVEQLRAGAERIGQGDLGYQIEVTRPDEIGEVAEAFNDMASRLKNREALIKSHTSALTIEVEERRRAEQALQFAKEELEIRVEQRTAELSQANTQLEIDITKRKREALLREIVYQVLRAVSGQLEVDVVARSAVETLVRLTGYPHVCLALPNKDGAHWVVRGAAGSLAAELGAIYPIHQGVIGRAFKTGQTQWVRNILDDPNYVRDINVADAPALQSEVVTLVRRGDHLLGALNVESDRVDAFDDDDVAMMQSLAEVIALALENARLYDEAQQEITERRRAEAALREAEVKFRTLVEQVPAITYIAALEEEQTLYVSPQIEAVLGFTAEEWMADPNLWRKQLHPDDCERVLATDERTFATGEPFCAEYRIFARDGRVVWLHDESRWVRDENGKPRFTQGIEFDITERKEAEAALQESEERYELAVRGANDGLWDWNLKTDDVYYSPRWKAMLGHEDNEVGHTANDWLKRIHPDDLLHFKADLASHLEGNTDHFESEYRMAHADGRYRWILSRGLAVRDSANHAHRMAGSQTDITARKLAEERLAHDALHDGLTGLPNRSLFLDRLEHAIKRTKRQADKEHQFSVLFLDIDRFKLVNDSLGHRLGDELLIGIAERLQKSLRPGDTVARLGGDEFVILLEGVVDAADATHITDRLQKELSFPFRLNGHQVTVTASIGIVMSETGYERAEDLLRDADIAMYRAKTMGKARYEIFDTGMHAAVSTLLHLEADLRQAIEKQEFRVYFQPLVSLSSGRIVGTEALLRWQHPQRGLLPPGAFLTVLEETGMIVPVGEWILRAACAQNKAWQDGGCPHLRIAVNFSARQFQIKNLPELVKEVLDETGMDPATLELEITESTAMKDVELTLQLLNDLHEIGVGISLDDFGSSYSTLGYLKRYPFQVLKADRSFIMDIPNDSNDMAITAAIIAMAHSLKLRVVAEGVETQEQLDFLRSQKCDEVQGFLFSRPVPANELTTLLQKKRLLSKSGTKATASRSPGR